MSRLTVEIGIPYCCGPRFSETKEDGLSESDIVVIQESWAVAQEALGSEAIAVLLFQKIFVKAPDSAQLWSFGRKPDFDPKNLKDNKAFVPHGVKVVDTVSAAVLFSSVSLPKKYICSPFRRPSRERTKFS